MLSHKLLIIISIMLLSCGLKSADLNDNEFVEMLSASKPMSLGTNYLSPEQAAIYWGHHYRGLADMFHKQACTTDLVSDKQLAFRAEGDKMASDAAASYREAMRLGEKEFATQGLAVVAYHMAEVCAWFGNLYYIQAEKAYSGVADRAFRNKANQERETAIRYYYEAAHYGYGLANKRIAELQRLRK